MGKQKTTRPTSPQVVATLSSLLLLLVSCALGFYFMELRGPGLRTLLSGSQASEVLVLLGGLAAIVLTGHLAVANAARSAQGTNTHRKLLRRAVDVDSSDPGVLEQFSAVPELRDLVGVLVAEKEQGRQLQDALESVRGEHQGLLAGMERSLGEGGRMRQDHPSELGRKVATLWNSLLERLEEKSSAEAPALPEAQTATAVGGDSGAMESRLRQLEDRVSQLHASLSSDRDPLLVTEDAVQGSDSLLLSEVQPEVVEIEEEADPLSPLLQEDEDPSLEPSAPVSPNVAEQQQVAEPQFADPQFAEPQVPDVEEIDAALDFDDIDAGIDSTFAPPQENDTPTFAVPWREQGDSSPVSPQDFEEEQSAAAGDENEAQEHTFSEWGGSRFAPAPEASGSEKDRDVSNMRFPEFATPRKDTEDHVEVTYDGSTRMDKDEDFLAFDMPTQEAFVDDSPVLSEEDEVVDLKSLGARETSE